MQEFQWSGKYLESTYSTLMPGKLFFPKLVFEPVTKTFMGWCKQMIDVDGYFLHQYVKSFLNNMVGVVSVDLGTQELPGNMSVQQQGLDKSAFNASS